MVAFSSFNKFYELIQELKKNKLKYIIYGNGTVGKTIQALLPETVIAYVDINSDTIYDPLHKVKIYNPKNLINLKYDKIIISVLGREDEIIRFLVEKLKIDRSKIITIDIL